MGTSLSAVRVAVQSLWLLSPTCADSGCTGGDAVCVCCCCQVAHVGDALADTAAVDGGAAGIIVDLFADGQLIPQLTQVRSRQQQHLPAVVSFDIYVYHCDEGFQQSRVLLPCNHSVAALLHPGLASSLHIWLVFQQALMGPRADGTKGRSGR